MGKRRSREVPWKTTCVGALPILDAKADSRAGEAFASRNCWVFGGREGIFRGPVAEERKPRYWWQVQTRNSIADFDRPE